MIKIIIKKLINIMIVFFLAFTLVGCSKDNSTDTTENNDKENDEIIEMSVKELNEITSDLEKSKSYEDKKIKVKGYYWLYINLERDIATKYVQDSPVDANYSVVLNDHGLLGDDYIGGEELELTGRIAVDGSLVDFYVITAVVDGKSVGINGSAEKQTIEVTKISDFNKNLDYYQGTEVTLYGKIERGIEGEDNSLDFYLVDVNTKEKVKLYNYYESSEICDLIKKENSCAIITFCNRKTVKVGGLTYDDESRNVYYNTKYVKVIEKTDNIKIIEKKKTIKDYSTVLTPKELCLNYDKYENKLITLDGYGYISGYYDGHDEVPVQYIMADESGKYQVRVFSKHEEVKEKYGFNELYKYIMKGTVTKNDKGFICLEIDEN